ncbi:MAG: DUF2752 domain-containing protein [Actinomycetota bacterium]|nr:DUF2752 domain-containing protein [Actinomycetota bacterium]MDQ2959332.1 DUF2752 domain-containing protein [Actinomycetota bacterium]
MDDQLISHRSRYREAPVITGALAALGAAGLYLVNPNTTHVPLCPLHAMTGLWCPLCGATRATYALLHGDLATALHDNALYVLLLPLLAVLWWRWARLPAGAVNGRLLPRPVFWALLAVALVFGVLRNLPAGSWLAPPA